MAREVITEEPVERVERPSAQRPVAATRTSFYSVVNLIYLLFGLLEIALGFRFFFLLLGANAANGFVSFIYNLTEPFVAPFYGIFGTVSPAGTGAILDPATLVAMVVYAVVMWVLVRLVGTAANRPVDRV